jgi:alkylhydroperoxidase/carboxymuconolactone decarboxylase family protein YurZ
MVVPSTLSREERTAIEVAVLVAGDGFDRLGGLFGQLLDERRDFTAVREAILSMLFIAGGPRAFAALTLLARVCEEKGSPFPHFPDDTIPGGPEAHLAVGAATMSRVYGPTYDEFVRRFAHLDPELWSIIVGDAYGRCLSRPALDLRARWLVFVGALCTFGRDAQLFTHMYGALNCGAKPEEIEEVIALAEGHGYDVSEARAVWARIAGKRRPAPEDQPEAAGVRGESVG